MLNRSKLLWLGLITLFVAAFGSATPPALAEGGIVTLPNGGPYEVALGAALDSTHRGHLCFRLCRLIHDPCRKRPFRRGSERGLRWRGRADARGGHRFGLPREGRVQRLRGPTRRQAGLRRMVCRGEAESPDLWVRTGPLQRQRDLDKTFNKTGIVKTSFGSKIARINAIVLQSDGKILVTGRYENPSRCVVLARYTANGLLDSTFGSGGKVITKIPGEGMSIAIHNGGIVVGADTADGGAVIRFTAEWIAGHDLRDGRHGPVRHPGPQSCYVHGPARHCRRSLGQRHHCCRQVQ